MNTENMKIGIVGCGNISGQYLKGCAQMPGIEVVAIADIDMNAAKAKAAEFSISRVLTVQELIDSDEVEIVVNLTTPQAHAPINKQALLAGKHAYCEKPFATNRDEGLEVLRIAKERGLRVGCAPDTFLGGGMQSARSLVEEGAIGRPYAVAATMLCPGHERWHPNPEFYYKKGGGPLFDMGPYYLTALVDILGPIASVTGSAKTTFEKRVITSKPFEGKTIDVETPTHLSGILEFANGATGMSIFSFDARGAYTMPRLQIYGTEGSLDLVDPNTFENEARISHTGGEFEPAALRHQHKGLRGIGVAEMANAIRHNRPHRASGSMAYHVFDTMSAYEESEKAGKRIEISSTFEHVPTLPPNKGEIRF